jgi:hypothetical protein
MRGLVLAAVVLAACAADRSPGEGLSIETLELSQTGGCADVVFYARAPDGSAFLQVSVSGLLEEALASGETEVTVFALPDAAASVRLQRGTMMTQPCDDAVSPQENVEAVYAPSSGTAVITIEPGDASLPIYETRGRGTLELHDVVLDSDGAESITIDDFAVDDVPVGWLPG